jgi:predicted anti-sigma-YlaC factor YlaD
MSTAECVRVPRAEEATVMTCREFIEFLLDYREERLALQERERFDAHLGVCPDCRTYLETYGKTVDLARISDDEGVPTDAPEDLIQAILRSRSR